MLDKISIKYNPYYFPQEEDDLHLRSQKQPETKYKFELGGLLVYDSKAKIVKGSENSQIIIPESRPFLGVHKKDLTKSTHSGNLNSDYSAFLRMKYHTPDPPFTEEYSLEVPQDGITLTFNSKFESGNLHKAIKITDYEYMLYLNADTNTNDQSHWYYFSVYNPRKTSITFKITNMLKKDFLYLAGMKPCVYSTLLLEKNGIQWHRDCTNVSYIENTGDMKGLRFVGSKKYYTLSFTYDFRYENDLVYFAYAVPYTYTKLCLYLSDLQNRHPNIVRVNQLCRTLAGNSCEMVTVTQSVKDYFPYEEEAVEWSVSSNSRRLSKLKAFKKEFQEKKVGSYKASKHQHKKGVVLTARVHSGETVSSYMMLGAMDFLVSSTRAAKLLRKNFVFKIIPMLNPDGCKYGNYRCSLLGIDLNRRWNQPNKALHPTIYYTKKMIEAFSEKHELILVCDMHGHTKKKNVFMYGCSVKSYEPSVVRRNVMARVVPYLLSLRNKLFSFKDSHFRMDEDRKATARVVLWESFGISHCYTLEASFYGPEKLTAFGKKTGLRNDLHMTEKDLGTVGADLCKLCLIFTDQQMYMKKVRITNDYLRHLMTLRGLQLVSKLDRGKTKDEKKLENIQNEFKEVQIKAKEMNKVNKISENKEVEELENCETQVKAESEVAWENIEVVPVEPDSDSGGSDSNCSFDDSENIPVANAEVQNKVDDSKVLFKKKSKKMNFPSHSTPQPCELKRYGKNLNESSTISYYLNHSPKSISPKKNSDVPSNETLIVPKVFVFPEDKVPEYFPSIKYHDNYHIKESQNMQKNRHIKIRPRMESIQSYDRYSGACKKSIDEELLKVPTETEKVFGRISGKKLLNDFFNSSLRKNNAHSLAASTRFKIEKIFFNK